MEDIKVLIQKNRINKLPLEKVFTYLKPSIKDNLYRIAKENKVSVSELVRVIINEFLKEKGEL